MWHERRRRGAGPLPDVSVVLPGRLLIGASPTDAQLQALTDAGVTAVLSLQEPDEAPIPPAHLRARLLWERLAVADGHAGGSMSAAQLAKAVERLRCWTDRGETVYLHCLMGIGRAPTVAAAFLARTERLSLGEALARVKSARPQAGPTAQQLVVLAGYLAGLSRGRVEPPLGERRGQE